MDTTECPSHGMVRVFAPTSGQVSGGGTVDPPFNEISGVGPNESGNEVFGTNIILHGARPAYDFENLPLSNNRGILTYMGFNGETPVLPGQLGQLTFDLPAYGIVDNPPPSSVSESNYVTVFDDWTLHYHTQEDINNLGPLQPGTGILYVLGYDSATHLALLGNNPTYIADGEIL